MLKITSLTIQKVHYKKTLDSLQPLQKRSEAFDCHSSSYWYDQKCNVIRLYSICINITWDTFQISCSIHLVRTCNMIRLTFTNWLVFNNSPVNQPLSDGPVYYWRLPLYDGTTAMKGIDQENTIALFLLPPLPQYWWDNISWVRIVRSCMHVCNDGMYVLCIQIMHWICVILYITIVLMISWILLVFVCLYSVYLSYCRSLSQVKELRPAADRSNEEKKPTRFACMYVAAQVLYVPSIHCM